MFEKITPEEAGISSDQVLRFINYLEKRGAIMHSVLMLRRGKIFSEHYWAPFHKDFLHRMYSETKSYVSIAIGLLLEEGKLSLSDTIASHFPERIEESTVLNENLASLTVRQMLTMTTAGGPRHWWFGAGDPDRTHLYLNDEGHRRAPGTLWEYDSAGSQVLSSLVEKLAGMPLLDYLKLKLFNKMGTFQSAEVLKIPNGESWGDSALLCTPRDMASFGQLLLQGGVWNGERLMSEEYIKEATAKQVDNRLSWAPGCFRHGYGYQIWRTEQNGFAFVGMGDQLTICLPDRDFVFVCTADHQGTDGILRDLVVNSLADEPLPADSAAESRLTARSQALELRAVEGDEDSPYRSELSGTRYVCDPNPMGITEFTFRFAEDGKTGTLYYKNAQGDKELPFGVGHNVFGKFPELGYSDDIGSVREITDFRYDDAVSAAWLEERKLIILTQVIDRYFGVMSIVIAFNGDRASARFTKCAEHFFEAYEGNLYAKKA